MKHLPWKTAVGEVQDVIWALVIPNWGCISRLLLPGLFLPLSSPLLLPPHPPLPLIPQFLDAIQCRLVLTLQEDDIISPDIPVHIQISSLISQQISNEEAGLARWSSSEDAIAHVT